MIDLRDRMREHLRSRMDSMLECPPMWGSDEAVELQFLLLLDMLYVVERPDDTRDRVIIDSFIAFIHRKIPDAGCVMLAANLKRADRSGEFVAILREFREYVEQRLAATAEKDGER